MNFPDASPRRRPRSRARGSRPAPGARAPSERKTYFAIAMSAVASMPCPVTSPSTTASRPSLEHEVVVDVAAHVQARRGLVDVARARARRAPGAALGSSERCIVSANVLLLLRRGARCRSRARPGRRSSSAIVGRVLVDRPRRVERERASASRAARAGVATGRRAPSTPGPETGSEGSPTGPRSAAVVASRRAACPREQRPVELIAAAAARERARDRSRAVAPRTAQRRRIEQLGRSLGHADHGRVDPEQVDHAARERVERRRPGDRLCANEREIS